MPVVAQRELGAAVPADAALVGADQPAPARVAAEEGRRRVGGLEQPVVEVGGVRLEERGPLQPGRAGADDEEVDDGMRRWWVWMGGGGGGGGGGGRGK